MRILKQALKWILRIILFSIIGFVVLVAIWYFYVGSKLPIDSNQFYLRKEYKEAYMRILNHPQRTEDAPKYILHVLEHNLNEEKLVNLDELKGKVVVLYWFGKCKYHPTVPDNLGELARKYKDDLNIYIISHSINKPIEEIKNKYPELNICEGENQHKETVFGHSASQHTVLIDRDGKILTYGDFPIDWCVEKLIKGEEFLQSEFNILDFYAREHKMHAYVKLHNEFLAFERCNFTDSQDAKALLCTDYSINCANLTGRQLYQIVTKTSHSQITFKDVDSVLFSNRFNFCYGINELKYIDTDGKYNFELAKVEFKQAVKGKLDSIFDVNSSLMINGKDSVLVINK